MNIVSLSINLPVEVFDLLRLNADLNHRAINQEILHLIRMHVDPEYAQQELEVLLARLRNQHDPPPRDARDVALECERNGLSQAEIADVLNDLGYTYKDLGPFTQPRVWHLLNPEGVSQRKKRLNSIGDS